MCFYCKVSCQIRLRNWEEITVKILLYADQNWLEFVASKWSKHVWILLGEWKLFINFVGCCDIKACLNGCNMLRQHHPTLLATRCCLRLKWNTMLGHVGQCWIVLEDVGWSLISVKLFIQHRPTFFFEHAHLWTFTCAQSLRVRQSEGIVIPEGTAFV